MKKVVVTGSTSGIGLATARRLIVEGYYVIMHGSGMSTEEYKKINKDYPAQTDFWIHDLSMDPEESFKKILEKHDSIWALVNNAGVIPENNIWDCDYKNLEKLFKINTFAPLVLSKLFMKAIDPKIGGRIVNISSVAVRFGMGRNASIQYASTKASLEALTIGLAKVGAPKNVLANAIRPGCIMTRIQKARPDFDERVNLIPLKRMGTEDEIANMVEFMISEKSSFTTGQVISISGGE